jgi:hypothetical protein
MNPGSDGVQLLWNLWLWDLLIARVFPGLRSVQQGFFIADFNPQMHSGQPSDDFFGSSFRS